MTDDEVMAELRSDTPLNRARKVFSSEVARQEQLEANNRFPWSPVDRRRLEFEAVKKIAAALSIRMEGDEAVRINRHWFAARLEALAQGEDPVQWAETMKLTLNNGERP